MAETESTDQWPNFTIISISCIIGEFLSTFVQIFYSIRIPFGDCTITRKLKFIPTNITSELD